MRRIIAALTITVAMLAIAFVAPVPPPFGAPEAAAYHCAIPGAPEASWGCGKVGASTNQSRWIELQDLRTDGHCIRVRTSPNNSNSGPWHDAGVQWCSGSVGSVQVSAPYTINRVRIYRGWSGYYRTIEW